jgi:uncharacterized protein YndB with AHSA1/START domain
LKTPLYPIEGTFEMMRALCDSIEIGASPETVFDWFCHLDEHYGEWHPDHISYSFPDGKPMRVGSALVSEELIHGKRHVLKGRITRLERPRVIEYRMGLPTSVVCPMGSFEFDPKEDGCVFTARLFFRAASALERLARRRVEAVREHMREEGENLKRLLEAKARGAPQSKLR